jgi:two-component sensor histidine kinase/HAMP domain-containing protein
MFERQDDVMEVLSASSANEDLLHAVVYRTDGTVFASYHRPDARAELVRPDLQPHGHAFTSGRLQVVDEILLHGEGIGTIFVEADLSHLQARFQQYLGFAVALLGIALLVAFLIASQLQRLISGPILHLASVAREVSELENYSLRATARSRDEMGFLIDSFNDMLTQIEYRDVELQKAQSVLRAWADKLELELVERKKAEQRITASLEEKEVMLKEIHHRVKNNLQVVSSLLNLQSRQIRDRAALEMFTESQNRVKSMALIHEKLYQSEDLARVDFTEYARNLSEYLFRAYDVNGNVELDVEAGDVKLGINSAVPCGLIVNELVSNSLKHAFPNGSRGRISIRCYRSEKKRPVLVVGDDGAGIPDQIDVERTDSLGLQVVSTLIHQLSGTLELDRSNGTRFTITFEET